MEIFLGAFAEKTDPMSGGRQLPGHWSSRRRRVLTQSSVIGTQYPRTGRHRPGRGPPGRWRGRRRVRGEGSTSRGLARGDELGRNPSPPLIFVIENNHYAISSPGRTSRREVSPPEPRLWVPGYRGRQQPDAAGVQGDAGGGPAGRAGEGPTLIEAETYRYYAHTSDDNDTLYRSREGPDPGGEGPPVPHREQAADRGRRGANRQQERSRLWRAVEAAEAGPNPSGPPAACTPG